MSDYELLTRPDIQKRRNQTKEGYTLDNNVKAVIDNFKLNEPIPDYKTKIVKNVIYHYKNGEIIGMEKK